MDNVRPLRPKKQPPKPQHSRHVRRRVITSVVAAIVILVLVFGSRILGLYVDWLWFGEVGFRGVFWTRIWWQVLVGVVAFAIFLLIVEFNVELARRLAPSYRVTAAGDLLEPRSDRVRRWVGWGGLGVSLVAAFIAGVSASSQWQTFLLYVKQTPFGEKDAIFGHDIAFYVFSLPMWQALQTFVFGALIASLVLAAIMHVVMGGIDLTQTAGRRGAQGAGGAGEEEAGPASPFARAQRAAAPQLPQFDIKLGGRAVAHLSGILAAIFVVVGVGQLFRGWDLLYSTAGAIYGAAYTDVHIRLPLTYVTMGIAFLLAAVLVWNIWRRRQWWPVAIAVWIVALIVLRGIVPAAYQSLIVNPNQLTKERKYIANNLVATKLAYQLNSITQTNLSPKTPLTPQKLADNEPTLRNIRLWDPSHAGHELPAAAGTPAVLLVPRRRRRPLHGGRRVSPDDALAARAQHRRVAEPGADLGQSAHHLHARLRRRDVGGEPGHERRLTRLPRAGHPAAERAGTGDQAAAHLLRRARHRLQPGQDQGQGVRLSRPQRRCLLAVHRDRRHPHLPAPQPARLLRALRHHQVLHHVVDRQREPHHHQELDPAADPRRSALPHPGP